MTQLDITGFQALNQKEILLTRGGAEPAKGSYAAGYAVGSWFREMYSIWSYGLTHLTEH